MVNRKNGKKKMASVKLNTHIKTFLAFLKKDWKENKDKENKDEKCFLYQHFSETKDSEEKIKKSISEFFYNIEKGRSLPLTLQLLIDFCEHCEKTPNQILKFQQGNNLCDVACDIKTIEKKIKTKLLNRNIILPIKIDIRYTTIIYIRFKNNKIDYLVTNIPFLDLFPYDVEEKERNLFFYPTEIYVFKTYVEALSEYEYRINKYTEDLSDDDDKINWINPKLLNMFETSLFYYEEVESVQESIKNKIEQSQQNIKQKTSLAEER